ncbi:GH116 family glycosyl hydrolase [Candidatus Margulisiibacteriota bacterium]
MIKTIWHWPLTKFEKIKRLPPRDQGHYLPFDTYPHGCPIGGFGAGTIGRTPYGDFRIWHHKIGAHIYEKMFSCAFHARQQVGKKKPIAYTLIADENDDGSLKYWNYNYPKKYGSFGALYPKALYEYNHPQMPVKMSCTQFSPILPHNYKETSYPLGIFKWNLKNTSSKKVTVSLMFTFANIAGWTYEDMRPGVQDNWLTFVRITKGEKHIFKNQKIDNKNLHSILMTTTNKDIDKESKGSIVIGALTTKNKMKMSIKEKIYIRGDGEEVWKKFKEKGEVVNKPPLQDTPYQAYGSALCVKITMNPHEECEIPFFLVWDFPTARFGKNNYIQKQYTKYFRNNKTRPYEILKQAAKKYANWEKQIDNWHKEIVTKSKFAPRKKKQYIKGLINEMYFLSDGGSYWDAKTGNYGLLECFDYPFYETLDVRFYGSFPLLKYWPEIEKQVMLKFASTVPEKNNNSIRYHKYETDDEFTFPSHMVKIYEDVRKIKGSVPHDLGSPKNNPFNINNGYTWQNVNYWKDLNTKFVLMVYRNYFITKDKKFLKKCWPAMKMAMEYLLTMDKDHDGIPENAAYPDQTYDNWLMVGVSAYCGSLWLAALKACIQSAKVLKKDTKQFQLNFEKAQKSFIKKLWNKDYFKFCEKDNAVMTDQLIGQWYCSLMGLGNIVDEAKIKKTLKKIYTNNFLKVKKGEWGVISGMSPSGKRLKVEQANDVWVGANYAFASLLFHFGMHKEAEKIVNTMIKITFEKGFFFRTPEGWDTEGHFTATMYMRPNAIWSLEF